MSAKIIVHPNAHVVAVARSLGQHGYVLRNMRRPGHSFIEAVKPRPSAVNSIFEWLKRG